MFRTVALRYTPGMSDTLLAGLAEPDPAARARALERVRFRDLRDPAVLRAVLRACRDPAEIPGRPASTEDPFAAFFGGGRGLATVADAAAERLAKTGLPEDPGAVAVVADVLGEPGPAGRLPRAVAKALGETRFTDLVGAVERLVPALDPYDEPLFEAIARLPEEAWPTLAALATAPLRPRLLQELLNHAPAHALTVTAAEEAIASGRTVPDASATATLLGVLASWAEPAAARIARHLEDRHPFAIVWRAVDDAEARGPLRSWLAAGAPGAPPGVLARVADVLRQRECVAGFPVDALLRVLGEERGLVGAWGVDEDVAELLREWVERLPEDRAWNAVRLLARDGRHGAVLPAISAALGEVPWDADLLDVLARAVPPVPGLAGTLVRRLAADPDAVAAAAGALEALGPEACRAAAEVVLSAAERAPVEVERVGKGTVRDRRRGVDVESLAPVVAAAGDPALAARLDAVMPVVRAGAPPEVAGSRPGSR